MTIMNYYKQHNKEQVLYSINLRMNLNFSPKETKQSFQRLLQTQLQTIATVFGN